MSRCSFLAFTRASIVKASLGVFASLAVVAINTSVAATPSNARTALEKAYEAVEKKQWNKLDEYVVPALADPLLGAYPRYWQLRYQLQTGTGPVPNQEVQDFINNSNNKHLADRLQSEWIVASARAGDYNRALSLEPVYSVTASTQCASKLSRVMTGQQVNSEKALEVFAPAAICWSMLDELAKRGVVSFDDIVFKLRGILETNQTGTAQRMAAIIFNGAEMKQYAALIKNPKTWLKGQSKPSSRAQEELITIALSRLARGGNRSADADYIQQNWANVLPAENIEWVYSQFGLIAALNVESDAARWYRMSGQQRLTDYNHAWEVRSELRGHPIDWERVQQAINRMTERQASEPVWVYWLGRAHAALGNKAESMRLYATIANELNFYGQLANEELGHTPYIPDLPEKPTTDEVDSVRANIGLQRAIEMFKLGWRMEAVQQWVYALQGMSDRELLAAAEYAKQEHIYDRVVNTSLMTRDEIDFRQRFIAPFEGRVTEKAREINLDPAWVYGLIRQESRFITDARSRVGASGLMQLMPDTARWVAKKIGMTDFHISKVNEFDTNTVLGTNYLRIVLNQLNGSEVLASAGYNAGPGRPKQWRSKLQAPVEGAIFAETIPFTETRLYVKNVMSNAVYYSMMFTGEPQYLKERLGVIAPSGGSQVAQN